MKSFQSIPRFRIAERIVPIFKFISPMIWNNHSFVSERIIPFAVGSTPASVPVFATKRLQSSSYLLIFHRIVAFGSKLETVA